MPRDNIYASGNLDDKNVFSIPLSVVVARTLYYRLPKITILFNVIKHLQVYYKIIVHLIIEHVGPFFLIIVYLSSVITNGYSRCRSSETRAVKIKAVLVFALA